jgi:hypothetical protein
MRLGRSLLFSFTIAMLSAAVSSMRSKVCRRSRGYGKASSRRGRKRKQRAKSWLPTTTTTTLPVVVSDQRPTATASSAALATPVPKRTPIEIAVDGNTVRFSMPSTKSSWEGN